MATVREARTSSAEQWALLPGLLAVHLYSCHSTYSPNGHGEAMAVFCKLCWIARSWRLSGGKREDYQNCFVLYCVLKLCIVISTLRWAVLTVLWIGFSSHRAHFTVCRFIYVICLCSLFFHAVCMSYV